MNRFEFNEREEARAREALTDTLISYFFTNGKLNNNALLRQQERKADYLKKLMKPKPRRKIRAHNG